jgi:hypothetical protein
MKYIQWYLDVMYPTMYKTFYSCTWFQSEKNLIQHIKQFLQETENAIIAFNNNYHLEQNK